VSIGTCTGAFLYEHGDAVYDSQGLRAFKEKFDPVSARFPQVNPDDGAKKP
jgi:hypothetical protein